MDETNVPLDKLGRELRVGDFIVYGSLLGRSAALKVGRIMSINPDDSDAAWGGSSRWRIRVKSVEKHWSGPYRAGKGTLLFPERTCIIPADMVPPDIYALLEDY